MRESFRHGIEFFSRLAKRFNTKLFCLLLDEVRVLIMLAGINQNPVHFSVSAKHCSLDRNFSFQNHH